MPEEETTLYGGGSSTAQPKVHQLTEEAQQNLIQAQMGTSSSSALPSGHMFSRIDQHKKAEVTKEPILAEFLKKKEKEETKKKRAAWKTSRRTLMEDYLPNSESRVEPDLEFSESNRNSAMIHKDSVSEQSQPLIQSKAISLCDETQLIRINPLSVSDGGGTARAAQPSTPSVNSHRNSGPGIIAGPKCTAWPETIATARSDGKEELAQILGTPATDSLAQGTTSAYSAMSLRVPSFYPQGTFREVKKSGHRSLGP
ncbi:unnamed protein product [Haemonchus placei]|uniref:Protein FAM179B n=1 Tax=Haemonchus placei TaxID=6290 RepID=A0A0N4X4K0_HAEPC|nr:unnamed protein product [Haemonchus placei]